MMARIWARRTVWPFVQKMWWNLDTVNDSKFACVRDAVSNESYEQNAPYGQFVLLNKLSEYELLDHRPISDVENYAKRTTQRKVLSSEQMVFLNAVYTDICESTSNHLRHWLQVDNRKIRKYTTLIFHSNSPKK